jgi:hypothetical protein
MSFSLFIWPPSWNNSISFSTHSRPIISHYNAPLVLVLLTNPTNTWVLANTKKFWEIWFLVLPVCISMTNGGTGTVPQWEIVRLAAPALIDRSITNYWAGVSGKGNIIIPRWRPYKKGKEHLSPWPRPISIICHLPDPPCFSLVTIYL